MLLLCLDANIIFMGGTGENSVLRQRLRKGRLCVLHSGSVYDVTDFSDRHPGGKEWLVKYSGHDVTRLMQEQSPHKHTKAAYNILKKYRVLDVDEHDKQNGAVHSDGLENAQFYSMKDDPLVDWSKPILAQIPGLKENYYQWVHEPVDTSLRLFHYDFVEFFSKCPWYMVPIIWVPVTIIALILSYTSMTDPEITHTWNLFATELTLTPVYILPIVLFGIVMWTFNEYVIHRWIFHMCPPSNVPLLLLLHFILHGQHHKSPMDRNRLVFPTVPAVIFGVLIVMVYRVFMPWPAVYALIAGTLIGYMGYDLTHYYIHHGDPIKFYFKSLKKYHIRHHFEQQQLGFGISSKLWDYFFATVIPDSA